MKIKNLTSQKQIFTAEELVGGRAFTISVEGHGVTDIEGLYVPHLNTEIFEILRENNSSTNLDSVKLEPLRVESPLEESEDIKEEAPKDTEETPTINEDKFICKECGLEFASARGLNTHINKVHPENK